MVLGIISVLLKVFVSGFIKQDDNKTAIALKEVDARIATMQEQSNTVRNNPLLKIAAGSMAMFVALWFNIIMTDTIFSLEGDVPLPPEEIMPIVWAIVGFLFYKAFK